MNSHPGSRWYTDVSSYRPISNLSVLSKLLERLVVRQLLNHLTIADLLPALQSGFERVIRPKPLCCAVLSDILHAVDHGHVAVLVLLDLSAAFDHPDAASTFGIHDVAQRWIKSHLSGQTQYTYVMDLTSHPLVYYAPDVWRPARFCTGSDTIRPAHP